MGKGKRKFGIVYRDSHSLVYGWKYEDEEAEVKKEKASSKGKSVLKTRAKWNDFYRNNKKGRKYGE